MNMNYNVKSIRPFIGAKDYTLSRSFYRDIGFEETILSPTMCVFEIEGFAFYLQKAYVQDWIDNTMVFLEVDDVTDFWKQLLILDLASKYEQVRITPIQEYDWGKECFIHDPSGVLWHIGEFYK